MRRDPAASWHENVVSRPVRADWETIRPAAVRCESALPRRPNGARLRRQFRQHSPENAISAPCKQPGGDEFSDQRREHGRLIAFVKYREAFYASTAKAQAP